VHGLLEVFDEEVPFPTTAMKGEDERELDRTVPIEGGVHDIFSRDDLAVDQLLDAAPRNRVLVVVLAFVASLMRTTYQRERTRQQHPDHPVSFEHVHFLYFWHYLLNSHGRGK